MKIERKLYLIFKFYSNFQSDVQNNVLMNWGVKKYLNKKCP
jgi:hypothetical protein